ncbi:MAG: hypothetical protein ABI443_02295 [Chthoniobacterales bacterium]
MFLETLEDRIAPAGLSFTNVGKVDDIHAGVFKSTDAAPAKFHDDGDSSSAGATLSLSVNRTLHTSADTSHTTDFKTGDGTTSGNARLASPSSNVGALYTAGSMTVHSSSHMNLSAGSLAIYNGPTTPQTLVIQSGYGISDTSLSRSGAITLNTFNLELNYDGTSLSTGSDLVLFNYPGLPA